MSNTQEAEGAGLCEFKSYLFYIVRTHLGQIERSCLKTNKNQVRDDLPFQSQHLRQVDLYEFKAYLEN